MAIKKKLEENIVNWNPIYKRILTIDLRIKGRDIKICGIYALTNDSNTSIKEDVFDKFSEKLSKIKTKQVIIILKYLKRSTSTVK